MTERRFTYLIATGGVDQDMYQQTDTDTAYNTIAATELTSNPHKMLYSDGSSTIRSITVDPGDIVGYESGGAGIAALNAGKVRTILDVELGAEVNKGKSVGIDAGEGVFPVFKEVNEDGEVEIKSIIPVSAERLYLIGQADRIAMDPLVAPYSYVTTALPTLGTFTTLFKNNSQAKLLMEVNCVVQGSAPKVGFILYRDTTRESGSWTKVADFSAGGSSDDAVTDTDGTGNGTAHKDDAGSLITNANIPANNWVMLQWESDASTTLTEFHLTLHFSANTTI